MGAKAQGPKDNIDKQTLLKSKKKKKIVLMDPIKKVKQPPQSG